MTRAPLTEEIAAVRDLYRDLGLGEVAPALIKAAHHTTLRLAPLPIVARVQSAEPLALAADRARREVAVTRHLAHRGAPTIAPLTDRLAGPHAVPPAIVTLWPDIGPARTADDDGPDAVIAAATLAAVHRDLHDYAGDLPPYTQALDRCWQVLFDGDTVLGAADRGLLAAAYRRLRDVVEAVAAAWIPLHGDAHLGNLLLGADGARWTDFEDACRGPREYDLAGLPPVVWPRDADHALIAQFADLKSVCVAVWCAADRGRSAAVREAADYHLRRVRAMAASTRSHGDDDRPPRR